MILFVSLSASLVAMCYQIINVYNQQYESAAQFWPSVHGRIITALIVSQLVLLGLLSTKDFEESTPALLVLPVLTFWFHKYCKNRYEPAFVRNPLQVFLSPLQHILHRVCVCRVTDRVSNTNV